MQVINELGYILIIMIGVTAMAMQAMSGFKHLDAKNAVIKSNNTTIFMALIVVFNICDFLIVFLKDLIGDLGVAWIYVIENVLEVAMAYVLIAVLRDFIAAPKVKWLPVFFIAVASVILWTDTIFTVGIAYMSEHVYMGVMCFLNGLPVLVTVWYCSRYIRTIFVMDIGRMVKVYMLVHSILFVVLCVITTINTIDSRTAWDFVKYDEEAYLLVWLMFNIFNVVFIWSSCQIVPENERKNQTIEEKIEKLAEKYALSGREEEIAMLLYKGHNNNEIADILCLSINTVKVHTSNLYKKMGVTNRLQAVQVIRDDIKS